MTQANRIEKNIVNSNVFNYKTVLFIMNNCVMNVKLLLHQVRILLQLGVFYELKDFIVFCAYFYIWQNHKCSRFREKHTLAIFP